MNEIAAAAQSLAAAETQSADARDALEKAAGLRDQVRKRRSALDAERAAIVDRRKSGKPSDADGAKLAEIGADLEGIAEILAEREAAVASAQSAADAAQHAVAVSREHLDHARDAEMLNRLVKHCGELAGLLEKAMAEIAPLERKLGGRPRWFPPERLAMEIRRRDLSPVKPRV
jgi:chromosome segregation ATPase